MKKNITTLFIILNLSCISSNVFAAAINELERPSVSHKTLNIDELISATPIMSDAQAVDALMPLTEEDFEKVVNTIPNERQENLLELIDEQATQKNLLCLFCMDRLVPGQQIYDKKEALECEHQYHKPCLKRWFETNPDKLYCPCCQAVSKLHPLPPLTEIINAVVNGHTERVISFIKRGADIESQNYDDDTLLMIALENHDEIIARILIENGANVHHENDDGSTALTIAAANGHEQIARLLIEKRADVNHVKHNSSTALTLAVQNGHETTARLLVENGANVNHVKRDGFTPLMSAAHNGHEAIARLLVENGANVNYEDQKDGFTPLMSAAYYGHEAIARLLIQHGANVNHKDQKGFTILWSATQNGHKAIAWLLIQNGAKTDRTVLIAIVIIALIMKFAIT